MSGKSKVRKDCVICNRNFSLRILIRHMREKHQEQFEVYEKEYSSLQNLVCSCGKEFCEFERINFYILYKYYNVDESVFSLKRKYCSNECCKKYMPIWNKGLNKENNESMKRISETRKGLDNPIHKVLSDEDKKKKWLENLAEGNKNSEWRKFRKGKSYVELYGEERAREILENFSKASLLARAKNPKIGMYGKTHSEKTRQRLREVTSKLHADGFYNKISSVHQNFYNKIKEYFQEEDLRIEYFLKYYSIDIAIPNLKIAIEIDGDFFHCNESLGFKPTSVIQIRNLKNDQRKNKFLDSQGWLLIRLWENDVNNNTDECINKIREAINARKSDGSNTI